MRSFAPGGLELLAREDRKRLTVGADFKRVALDKFTHKVAAVGKTGRTHFSHHFLHAVARNLNQGAELFVKERIENRCAVSF